MAAGGKSSTYLAKRSVAVGETRQALPYHVAITNIDTHLASSDTEALGGDLAYRYGLTGSLAGMALDPAQAILSNPQFGSTPQALQPLSSLQDGLIKLS